MTNTYLTGNAGEFLLDTFGGKLTTSLTPTPTPTPTPPPPPPPNTPSVDGTRVPPAAQIVDNASAVWAISNGIILRNGQDSNGRGSVITWCGALIRVLSGDRWWSWTPSGWADAGTIDPCISLPPPPPPPPPPLITSHDVTVVGSWGDPNTTGHALRLDAKLNATGTAVMLAGKAIDGTNTIKSTMIQANGKTLVTAQGSACSFTWPKTSMRAGSNDLVFRYYTTAIKDNTNGIATQFLRP